MGNNRNVQRAPGKTYYPVNPLGPFSGPRASDYPQGTVTPMTTAPTPGAQPPPSTPPAATPPASSRGRDYQHRLSGALMGNDTLISSLPQGRQDRMTQKWGTFGGGQPMPSTLGDFRSARSSYYTANPGQRPVYGNGGNIFNWSKHDRSA